MWLVRLLIVCFVTSTGPFDWVIACVVPLYKNKDDKYECASFRDISVECSIR